MAIKHYFKSSGVVALLALVLVSSDLAAEESLISAASPSTPDTRTESVELNKEYVKGYWTDTKNILTSPARWDKYDWLEASLVTGVAVGLYTQDDHIKSYVNRHTNTTTINLADDTKKLYLASFPAIAGLGAYGYLVSDTKAKTTFLLSAESFVITGAFVQVLKHTTGRHRPYTGDPHDRWSPGYTSDGAHQSFPSGDVSTAFSIATVVATEYDNWIVPPLAYGISTLVALERVHNNAHWSSDVFVASAIGYFTGKAVVRSHSKQPTLSFEPWIDGPNRGALISYRF